VARGRGRRGNGDDTCSEFVALGASEDPAAAERQLAAILLRPRLGVKIGSGH